MCIVEMSAKANDQNEAMVGLQKRMMQMTFENNQSKLEQRVEEGAAPNDDIVQQQQKEQSIKELETNY